jgi:hypothetical protein
LEPISDSLQKPVEGLPPSPSTENPNPANHARVIHKGAIVFPEHNRPANQPRHADKLYQRGNSNALAEVNILSQKHRVVKKNFETEMWVDGHKLPLNHFVQETIANVMVGFSKTLKGLEASPEKIEVKIKKLAKQVEVDAHTYP